MQELQRTKANYFGTVLYCSNVSAAGIIALVYSFSESFDIKRTMRECSHDKNTVTDMFAMLQKACEASNSDVEDGMVDCIIEVSVYWLSLCTTSLVQ